MTEIETLKTQLKILSLHTIGNIFEDEAKKAAKLKLSYTSYLAKLIQEELLIKTDKSINVKIIKAKFPWIKTIESFDFKFQPCVNEPFIKELSQLGFVEKEEKSGHYDNYFDRNNGIVLIPM